MPHDVAIVLVKPGLSPINIAIDLATGARGWSHCFVDPGWEHHGRDPIVIDISRERGVELSTWSRACSNRPTRRLELDEPTGVRVLEQLSRCLGRPYNIVAMILQPLQREALRGTYCSTVIAECLPVALRAKLPKCPCPADLLALEHAGCCRA